MRRTSPAANLALLAVGGLAGAGLTGCATDNAAAVRHDLLQAEDELTRTRVELRDARAELAVSERTAAALRTRLADGGAKVVEAPEQARSWGLASQLTVSKLLTGGLDRDGVPGDELLAVVLAPADEAGEPIKAPGAVSLELLDLAASGPDRTVGAWSFTAAEATETWRRTAIGTGYRFRLPLAPRPAGPGAGGGIEPEELHLVARFETTDGRTFDVTHPVRVNRAVGRGPAAPSPAPAPTPLDDLPPDPFEAIPFPGDPGFPSDGPSDPFAPDPFPPPSGSDAPPREPSIAAKPEPLFGESGDDPFAEF